MHELIQTNDAIAKIRNEIHSIKPRIIENRRYLHTHPECGFDTQNTEKMVIQQLQALQIEIIPSTVGVLGRIRGKDNSRLVALRADMDALPLQEENEVSYKSTAAGKMHACGHDGHTSMLLGAAEVLQNNRDLLSMDVLLIFQPAEEGPNLGGARIILADLEEKNMVSQIQCIFGLHLFNDFDLGQVGIRYGSLMSSTDEFDIKIIGKGGHAGQPHETVDALSIAAKYVTAMESFMSRGKNPFDPAVFSFGILQAGSTKNIVAETATLAGTIRCQSEETRALILAHLEQILKGICDAFGARYQLDILHGLPVLINDKDTTAYTEEILTQTLGDSHLFTIPLVGMGAEDFAYFAQKIPASFVWIGSRNEQKGFTYLAHHPKFDFDEDALEIGTQVLCDLALNVK